MEGQSRLVRLLMSHHSTQFPYRCPLRPLAPAGVIITQPAYKNPPGTFLTPPEVPGSLVLALMLSEVLLRFDRHIPSLLSCCCTTRSLPCKGQGVTLPVSCLCQVKRGSPHQGQGPPLFSLCLLFSRGAPQSCQSAGASHLLEFHLFCLWALLHPPSRPHTQLS